MGHRNSADTYLGTGDAKHAIDEMDGLGGHTDALNGLTDVQSIETDTVMPTITPETVSTHQTESEAPNPPSGDAKCGIDMMDGLTSHTDMSSGRMDAPSVETDTLTSRNALNTISIPQIEPETPDLPSRGTVHRPDMPNGSGNRAVSCTKRVWYCGHGGS